MAEEVLYASVGGETNKRKYDDSPSPVARRASGFSSPPDSAAPPPSYNNVPPPMSEIELAKQKAQEIAARLLNTSDPSKRARVENGGGVGGGFDSSDYGSQRPMGLGLGGPPQVASSGYPGPNKKIEIPNGRVGVIIGKGGETIKYLQLQSGAKIQVTRDMDADPNSATRGVELSGTPDQIAKAEQLISDVLSEAETGGSGIVSRRLTGQPSGAEQFVMKIPNNKVGLVIGKGGETIKSMQARTGARIQVIPLHLPPGDMSKERTVQIDGTSEQIEAAKQLVEEATSENRVRNPSMSGGYPQQGYQARPPSNWSQTGPPMQQQSGYGYTQPGAYPPAQFNMNQPPYSGYPPQPTSGGYPPNTWDQSAAQQNQHPPQGGAYDYYNQQPPQQQQQAPTDGSAYGYSQGQNYSQDSYGGYHAGYDQQQQQHQGYTNSTYGNVSNPTSAATQGEANQSLPAGQSYPPQASTQPGYGSYAPPQTQKPPSGQPGYAQSPSAQGGAYPQSGYPQSQPPAGGPGYGQVDSGSQRPPSQPGYGAPTYGAPPPVAAQGAYGQQYSSSYGGGYSQAPAYDATTPPPQSAQPGYGGGYSQAPAYDATTPPPQSAQTGGAAKASPSS